MLRGPSLPAAATLTTRASFPDPLHPVVVVAAARNVAGRLTAAVST
ncbi:MAG: hypothetical protein QM433_09830 [Euryarchaeota archaeon]|nr:hypothetical protein [Euryarchaeota archaeon]